MNRQFGKWLMITGAIIFIAGILFYFLHDKFDWLGRLPGDIRIGKKNFKFYFPFVTSIVLSLLITLILYIVKKLS